MDRGAWQATVHRVSRVRQDLATKQPPGASQVALVVMNPSDNAGDTRDVSLILKQLSRIYIRSCLYRINLYNYYIII